MHQETVKNTEFYQNCTQYFEFLRKKVSLIMILRMNIILPCLQYQIIN